MKIETLKKIIDGIKNNRILFLGATLGIVLANLNNKPPMYVAILLLLFLGFVEIVNVEKQIKISKVK